MELLIIILALILVFIGPLVLTFARRLFDNQRLSSLRRRIAGGKKRSENAEAAASPTSFDPRAQHATAQYRSSGSDPDGVGSGGAGSAGAESTGIGSVTIRSFSEEQESPGETEKLEQGWRPKQPGGVATKLDTAENLSVFKTPSARYNTRPRVQKLLQRLDRYTPLQRAIVWHEILSQPKSERPGP